MHLAPYLDAVRRDLAAAAALGGPDVARAAEMLAESLDASMLLCLLEVLSDAAADVNTKLSSATVEVRLRGRAADLVVAEIERPEAVAPGPPPAVAEVSGDLTRVTLRLPEALKSSVEQAATAVGQSVNAWLVRAVADALRGDRAAPQSRPGLAIARRVTGFGQA